MDKRLSYFRRIWWAIICAVIVLCCVNMLGDLFDWLNSNPGLGVWFAGIATFITALVALFGNRWWEFYWRPRLQIRKDPRIEEIELLTDDGVSYFSIITLLMVENKGRSIAESVVARIEKVVDINRERTELYHPTVLKWSGEPSWNPVDIYPYTHFFWIFLGL